MNKIWNLSLLCLGALVLIIQTAFAAIMTAIPEKFHKSFQQLNGARR